MWQFFDIKLQSHKNNRFKYKEGYSKLHAISRFRNFEIAQIYSSIRNFREK